MSLDPVQFKELKESLVDVLRDLKTASHQAKDDELSGLHQDIKKEMISLREGFQKHYEDDARNFNRIDDRMDKLMTMLEPIATAFSFNKEAARQRMAWVGRWAKILGFVMLCLTFLGVIWKGLLFILTLGLKH